MKQGVHPNYVECTITCACGSTLVTHATVPEIHLDICSNCHPFYTGKQKIVDSEGRVERFLQRYKKATRRRTTTTKKTKAKSET